MENLVVAFVYLVVGFVVRLVANLFRKSTKRNLVCAIWVVFLVLNLVGFYSEGSIFWGILMLILGTTAFWWKILAIYLLER